MNNNIRRNVKINGPDPLDVALGKRIRARRKELKMSSYALAKIINVTFQQVSKYEHGTNRVSFSMLVHIAHALDCRVTELVGRIDYIPKHHEV